MSYNPQNRNGQTNSDNSQPVVIASDQSSVPVTVTSGKIDVNAIVDKSGLATSTTQSDGSQKSQIVDPGGEAATVTNGKLDVNATVDNTGLATSTKQDTTNTSLSSIDGKLTDVATQTTLSAINTKLVSGTDIGDVTINNAGAGSAVNIQDGGNTITVDNGGTFAVQGTVVGTVADNATTPGAPVMVGGKAVATDGTDPSSVAEDDVAIFRTDKTRRLLVNVAHPNLFSVSADYASAQTDTSLQATPGAGISLYITDIMISNGATAGNITLLNGAGGAILWKVYPAINGGCMANLQTPIRLTPDTALCLTSTTVTTHSITISGFKAP